MITGRTAGSGIVFTREPIFRSFRPHGWYVAPIKVKLGKEEGTVGPLHPAKL